MPATARRLVLAALVLGACECGEDPQLRRVTPKLQLEADRVDFGDVPLGATRRRLFTIENTGNAELVIEGVDAAAPFGAVLVDQTIPAGGKGTVDLGFTPTNDEPQSGTLTIVSSDEASPTTVALTGRGVEGLVTVRPSVIDMTNTPVGGTRVRELVLSNLGIEDVEGRILTEGFTRPEHFSLTSLSSFSDVGTFAVGARGETVLDLEYRPFDFGDDGGRIIFEICGDRCGLEVEVVASAAQPIVRLVPPVLDFGSIGIGETRTQQVVAENVGMRPVQITSVTTVGGVELAAEPTRPVPLELGAGESLGINVELTPETAVAVEGEVVVTTTDPLAPEVRASVIGRGEGPLFVVSPEAISFGAQREMITHRRSLLLINSGSSDVTVETVSITGDPELALADLPGFPARIGSGQSIVVNVTFTPTALGEYMGVVSVSTDDPTSALVEVPVIAGLTDRLCELDYSPERVNFGLIPPTFVRTKSTTLRNVGTDDCTLLSGDFRTPVDPYISLVGTPFPVTLAPGQSVPIEFEYAPTEMVESKANFVIQTDDPIFPERHVTLLGSAAGYVDIFTQPEQLDFGAVRPSCNAGSREVRIFNAGTVDVDVGSIVLTSTAGEFRVTAPGTPFPLRAGSSEAFQVGYTAADIGVDISLVEITVPGLPYALVVPIQGEGNPQPRITDTYEQNAQQQVDVLFVIDDSCSMSDDQTALAQNFSSFISQANLRQVDFQIGITTTTLVPVAGALVGGIMTPSTTSLETEFTRQARVGTSGSGFERGLDAMAGAIHLAQNQIPPNDQFLRPGAGLAVIIVSDEDDQSSAPIVAYFNELRNAASSGFVTAVVTGGSAGCVSATGAAARAPRYLDFAGLTGGLAESICSNWSTTLANIGNAAFGLATRFDLSQAADVSEPIRVFVDGVEVPVSDWMYDAAEEAIIFTGPPPEGAEVRVEYTPAC